MAGISQHVRSTLAGPLVLAGGLLIFLLTGCGADMTEPPSGWETDGDYWWQDGVDTSLAFRSMESLEEIGVDEAEEATEEAGERQDASQRELQEVQFAHTIKQRLIALYRNHPEVVDSLFEADVYPEIQDLSFETDVSEQADEFQEAAYATIRENFQEPSTRLSLGDDVEVVYPDSLRQEGIGGRVRTQVYLDEEGDPQAVKLVESVHPTLDRIAMHATTQMRWDPAQRQRDGEWEDIASWARFTVNFATQ